MTELAAPPSEPVEVTELAAIDEAEGIEVVPKSFSRQTWERFLRHRLAVASVFLLALIVLAFFVGPSLWKWGFDERNVPDRKQGMSWDHPMGTDDIGRDLFARVLKGGQVSIRIGLLVAVFSSVVGASVGIMAGYFGKVVDLVISQIINLFLVVPALIVLLVFAVKLGGSITRTAILVALLSWVPIARIVRGQTLQMKEFEFVQAAKAAGAGPGRIMVRHILPNVLGTVFVQTTLIVGVAIVLESTLAFLGLGVEPPNTSLGVLVSQARESALGNQPSRALWPGGAIVLIVLCINFIGDGLRDAFDPTSRKTRE